MFDLVGHPVTKLRRVAIGPIRDATLPPGTFRDLSPEEVMALRAIRPAPPRPRTARPRTHRAPSPSAPPKARA
jgi:23S rRNA pseudouridine2605 synthase